MTSTDPLDNGAYPALYEAADKASLDGQRRYLRALRIRLASLAVAAIGGGLLLTLGSQVFAGWVVIVAFLAALGTGLWVTVEKPERAWYEGRAAAESAKTLTWRYAVGGESFAIGTEADPAFIARLREILQDLGDLDISFSTTSGEQLPGKLRDIRAGDFQTRKALYREGRIEAQRAWYERKAKANRIAARRWTLVLLLLEGLGLIGGVLIVAGVLNVDLVGIFATIAAGVTAWGQAKQYKTLATAYGVTAQELASVKAELDLISDEVMWVNFVGQAEEAISREHTLWRASRGARS